jgi:hypothetical protein
VSRLAQGSSLLLPLFVLIGWRRRIAGVQARQLPRRAKA